VGRTVLGKEKARRKQRKKAPDHVEKRDRQTPTLKNARKGRAAPKGNLKMTEKGTRWNVGKKKALKKQR